MAAAYMLFPQGLLPFLLPLSVLLFEPDLKSRRRMLPLVVVGGPTGLYVLWALAAYPKQAFIRENSIVYFNQETNRPVMTLFYVFATCGALLFSKVKAIVIFGIVNLLILLVVTAVKKYAFTSVSCAYAAISSLIILAYFWKSNCDRPYLYAQPS
jgi:hypothetical protein